MKRLLGLIGILVASAVVGLAQPADLDNFPISFPSASNDAAFNLADDQSSGPIVFDVNQDGLQDVIVTGRKHIWVFDSLHNSTQNARFEFDALADHEFCGSATIAFLSEDGLPWIVIGASRIVRYYVTHCPAPSGQCHHRGNCSHWTSEVQAWKIDGPISVPYATNDNFAVRLTTAAAGDLDGDGRDELTFVGAVSYGVLNAQGDGISAAAPAIFTFNSVTAQLEYVPQNDAYGICFGDQPAEAGAGQDIAVAQTVPAIADVNGDGIQDLVFLCYYKLFAVSYAGGIGGGGTTLWTHDFYDGTIGGRGLDLQSGYETVVYEDTNSTAWDYLRDDRYRIAGTTIADFDNDGALDIFLSTNPSHNEHPSRIWRMGANGSVVAYYDMTALPPNGEEQIPQSEMACADLSQNSEIRLFAPMAIHYGVGIEDDTTRFRLRGFVPSEPLMQAMGDPFPYDSSDEAWAHPQQFSGDFHTPAFLPHESGDQASVFVPVRNAFERYNPVVSSATAWATSGNSSGDPAALSGVVAADLNRNGRMEYVFTDNLGDGTSELHAFESTVAYSPESNEWSGYRNGPKHTGLYAQPVTGTQQVTNATWEGRIIVHNSYTIPQDFMLTIKPGSVIEFRPGAALVVYGTLNALGVEHDSIYFKPDGSPTNWSITVSSPGEIELSHCVLHDGDAIYLQGPTPMSVHDCRVYSMVCGLYVNDGKRASLLCTNNLIENCTQHGIKGMLSAGTFEANVVRDCGRSGIYWYGDHYATAQSPLFLSNVIERNGTSSTKMGGGWFMNTHADLQCNRFEKNQYSQIYALAGADLVMNNGLAGAGNTLSNAQTEVTCPLCVSLPPSPWSPLMRIVSASPELNYGRNTFHFDQDGTYILNASMPCYTLPTRMMNENHYEPDNSGPSPTNPRFCPMFAFSDTDPLAESWECGTETLTGLVGAEALYQEAYQSEAANDPRSAEGLYSSVIEGYSQSEAAVWSVRGYLRSGLMAELSATERHDTLREVWANAELPLTLRDAARKDAIHALVADRQLTDARNEVDELAADTSVAQDTLWIAAMYEVLTFLEQHASGSRADNRAADNLRRLKELDARILGHVGIRPTDEPDAHESSAHTPLASAHPNPFNSTVAIELNLPNAGPAKVEIFNLLGQKVTTLLDKPLDAGLTRLTWNADNNAAGVYLYHVEYAGHVETHKLLLLK